MGATGSGLIAVLDFYDGRKLRFGGDAAGAYRQATQIKFQTALPGGHGPGTIVVPRADWWDQSSAAMLSAVTVVDGAGRNVYEGRVSGATQPDTTHVEIQTEGWAKSLEDDETAAMIFVDRDLGAWGDPSNQRQINLVGGGFKSQMGSSEVTTDLATGNPCLKMRFDHLETILMRQESVYYGQGIPLKRVYYDVINHDNPTLNNMGSVQWSQYVELWSDDVATTVVATTGDQLPNPDTAYLTTTTEDARYVALTHEWAGATANAGGDWTIDWRKLAVYGNHGLPLAGPDPGGLYVSDIVKYAVGRWAPALRFGPDSVETTTNYAVPHSVFKDPTTAKEMVESLVLLGSNSFYPLDWFVYDERRFNLKSPGKYGRTWRLRRDEGAKSSSDGPDASNRINGVRVQYDPGDGSQRSVGPSGSNSTSETSVLAVSDPNHPANRAGLRKWRNYQAGITDSEGATVIGKVILAEANRDDWRGSITVSGDQRDSGVPTPCYMIRSGDQVVVEDDQDTRTRRVIATDYDSRRKNEMQISVGQRPDRLDTLLARAGVSLMGSSNLTSSAAATTTTTTQSKHGPH